MEPAPANPHIVTTVIRPRWSALGRHFGPEEHIELRIHLEGGNRYRYERVDGKELGDVVEVCRKQLAEAEGRLARDFHESRMQVIRSGVKRPVRPGSGEGPSPSEDLPESEFEPSDGPRDAQVVTKTGSAIFTVDREKVTDRINKLRSKPAEPTAKPAAPTPPPVQPPTGRELREEQRKALQEMAALRERSWRERRSHPSDMDLLPSEALPAEGEKPPEKRTSSVFRCDREVITDRINRLRVGPAPVPPPGADAGGQPAVTPAD